MKLSVNKLVFEKFDTTVDGFISAEIKDNQLAFNYNDCGDSYYDEEFIMELGKDNMKKLADFINRYLEQNNDTTSHTRT